MSEVKVDPAKAKFNALMEKYAKLALALGELEYQQSVVFPRRKRELEKEIDNLQRQASKLYLAAEARGDTWQAPSDGIEESPEPMESREPEAEADTSNSTPSVSPEPAKTSEPS